MTSAAGASTSTSGSDTSSSSIDVTTGTTQAATDTSAGDTTGTAHDASGATGEVLAGCFHAWSFDACDGPEAWTADKADPAAPNGPSWACGDPPEPQALGGAHTGVWATNLDGEYGEDESSALTSPAFSLADCAGATVYLSFAHLYEFGVGDGGVVQISSDGARSWTTLDPIWHGYCAGGLDTPWVPPGAGPGFCDGDDELWQHSLVALDAYAGQDELRIRFVFGSDGIIEQLGWYIDAVATEAY